MLLVIVDGVIVGSGVFCLFVDVDYFNVCEMKCLFVCLVFCCFGFGCIFVQFLMDCVIEVGYLFMLLDMLDDMEVVCGFYESLGFVEVFFFYFNFIFGVYYLKVEFGGFWLSYFG